MTALFPSSLTESLAWAATIGQTLFGVLLIVGFKMHVASILSGFLLLSFAIGMVTGLGVKTPFDYSVFSAASAAFLLAFWEPDSSVWPSFESITKPSGHQPAYESKSLIQRVPRSETMAEMKAMEFTDELNLQTVLIHE